jgi:hypothetical protein
LFPVESWTTKKVKLKAIAARAAGPFLDAQVSAKPSLGLNPFYLRAIGLTQWHDKPKMQEYRSCRTYLFSYSDPGLVNLDSLGTGLQP